MVIRSKLTKSYFNNLARTTGSPAMRVITIEIAKREFLWKRRLEKTLLFSHDIFKRLRNAPPKRAFAIFCIFTQKQNFLCLITFFTPFTGYDSIRNFHLIFMHAIGSVNIRIPFWYFIRGITFYFQKLAAFDDVSANCTYISKVWCKKKWQ